MKMTYLSRPPQNMNFIRGVCDRFRTNSLTSLAVNQWATNWLQWTGTQSGRDYLQSFVWLAHVWYTSFRTLCLQMSYQMEALPLGQNHPSGPLWTIQIRCAYVWALLGMVYWLFTILSKSRNRQPGCFPLKTSRWKLIWVSSLNHQF